jgi:hypothetical protein
MVSLRLGVSLVLPDDDGRHEQEPAGDADDETHASSAVLRRPTRTPKRSARGGGDARTPGYWFVPRGGDAGAGGAASLELPIPEPEAAGEGFTATVTAVGPWADAS